MVYFANKLNDGPGGDWFFKIYPVAAHCNHNLPAKTGSGYESDFIHQVHGCATKKGIVVVGCVWENGFENTGFRVFYSFC
ncbi:hypothetical protein D3C72_1912420 [compost metagenome]